MNTVEPMLQAIGVLVWYLAKSYCPEKVDGAVLKMIPHKTEVIKDVAGDYLWFNKSCASNRIATCIVHLDKPPGKRKQWYIYLGGGEVDDCQSQVLMEAVVKAKAWTWAALTLLASWILLGCCSCGPPCSPTPTSSARRTPRTETRSAGWSWMPSIQKPRTRCQTSTSASATSPASSG